MCSRRERPRRRRAAEWNQQFPPSDGDCHTPLPVRGAQTQRYHAISVQSSRPGGRGRRCFPPRTSMTAEVPAELAQPPAWTRPRWGRREATARRADFGLIRRGLAGYTERGGFRTDRSHRRPLGRQSPPEQLPHCRRPAGHTLVKAEIVDRSRKGAASILFGCSIMKGSHITSACWPIKSCRFALDCQKT